MAIIFLFFSAILIIISFFIYPFFLKKNAVVSNQILKNDKEEYDLKISIIVPFFNEFKALKKKLYELNKFNTKIKNGLKIILVNDGNFEFNKAKFRKFCFNELENLNIKIIKLKRNYGKTFAQYIAAKYVKTEFLILTDSNSIFDSEYFYYLNKIIFQNSKLSLFGGILQYKSSDLNSESFYWGNELKLKLNEQNNNLWNTGLFGSNIVISRELFLSFPYYNLCDFSLPLYYQLKTKNRVRMFKELMVYEKPVQNAFEIYKTKKRIIHRAFFGLYKVFKLYGSINLKMLFQIYIHKINRWFVGFWLLIILISLSEIFNIDPGYFFVGLLFLSLINEKIRYTLIVSFAGITGVLSFLYKKNLNNWIPLKNK